MMTPQLPLPLIVAMLNNGYMIKCTRFLNSIKVRISLSTAYTAEVKITSTPRQ
jgi:hypothetical protein